MQKIRLIDATLRSGERAPEAPYTVRQKLIFARSLDFLGIDSIEVGQHEVEAALETGIGRIAVSLGSIGLHPVSLVRAALRVNSLVKQITDSGRRVRFSVEDATRANMNVLIELCLAAIGAGADYIHVMVNGLGKRTYITPLRNLALALKVQYGIDTVTMLSNDEISRMVSKLSRPSSPDLAVTEMERGRASA